LCPPGRPSCPPRSAATAGCGSARSDSATATTVCSRLTNGPATRLTPVLSAMAATSGPSFRAQLQHQVPCLRVARRADLRAMHTKQDEMHLRHSFRMSRARHRVRAWSRCQGTPGAVCAQGAPASTRRRTRVVS
jgi:hypothetical protein